MIDVLEQMVAEGKHREAIALAEQLLRDGIKSPQELVAIQSALVLAHYRLKEWASALVPGDTVMQLAQEIGDWEAFGRTAMFVSTAYSRLGQYEAAVARTYDYIAHLSEYRQAAEHEGHAWYNLGQYFRRLDRPLEAARALTRALAVWERTGDHRNANGARHALIDAYLRTGDLERIPKLLALSAAYLRRHPDGWMVQDSWAHHMQLRSEYALATNRLPRARLVALRGLELANGSPLHSCGFHILLARIAQRQESPLEAVGHALASQIYARRCERPDVESEAAEVIYQLSIAFPDAIHDVNRYYLTL